MAVTTKYKLRVICAGLDDGRAHVELYSNRMSRNDLLPKYRKLDPHPFTYLCDADSTTCFEAVRDGQYSGTFTDSPVLRAIILTLRSEKAMRACAGKDGNWRRIRAALIKSLDLLWEG